MGLLNWLLRTQKNAMEKKGIAIEKPAERLEETDEDLRSTKLVVPENVDTQKVPTKFDSQFYGVKLHCSLCGETIQGKLRIVKQNNENIFFHKECLKKMGKQAFKQSIDGGI